MNNKMKYVIIAFLTVVIGGLFFKIAEGQREIAAIQTNPSALMVVAAPKQPEEVKIDSPKEPRKISLVTEDKIKHMVQGYNGDYAVYYHDLKSGDSAVYNNKSMVSASMIKMFILAKAYEDISHGKLSESELIALKASDKVGGAGTIQGMPNGSELSIKYLLRQMIIESDNVATNLVIKRLGMDEINKYIREHGYIDTRLARYMMDFSAQRQGRENYTSVRDLGKIFEDLYNHRCVNAEIDEKMLGILKEQTDNDKIPAGLPGGTIVAHKTGELTGVYNDGGIVYTQNGDYVLVVMANHVGQEAIRRIAHISRNVYENR